MWITVDRREEAEDGAFRQTFTTRFRTVVQAGKPATERIPVQFKARDIAGFVAQRDTFVVVVP